MATNQKSEKSTGVIEFVPQKDDMAPEDRRHEVLSFMAEHRLALKPTSVYRNMCLHRHITFGQATVANILQELTDSGDLRRVDPKQLSERSLVDLDPSEGRGCYIVTEQGRERARSTDF